MLQYRAKFLLLNTEELVLLLMAFHHVQTQFCEPLKILLTYNTPLLYQSTVMCDTICWSEKESFSTMKSLCYWWYCLLSFSVNMLKFFKNIEAEVNFLNTT